MPWATLWPYHPSSGEGVLQKTLVAQDPVNVFMAASWWMVRELGLANINPADVTVKPGPGPCGVAEILLPIDETDMAWVGQASSPLLRLSRSGVPCTGLTHAVGLV